MLCVLFLDQDELLDEVLTISLLLLKLLSERVIFLLEFPVFGLRAHGDIRDKLQMVLKLIFTFSFFSCFVATFGFLLLNGFLGPADLALVHACEVSGLLIF